MHDLRLLPINLLKIDNTVYIINNDGEMKMTNSVVRVGICVLVQDPWNPSKIFAGIRGPSCGHGKNRLALPGGTCNELIL